MRHPGGILGFEVYDPEVSSFPLGGGRVHRKFQALARE
jgi:hypothetical protein